MIIYNYYFAIFILAIFFFFISSKSPSILLALIIIIIISYYYFSKININNDNEITTKKNKIKLIENALKNRKEINISDYIFKSFPNEIKYLNQDNYFIELLLNIRFIKIFDEAKWSNLILLFEKFMKIYIYLLGDRYDINEYFQTFIDIRTNIIKELYSIFIIIPQKMQYSYNLNPFEEVEKTIKNFIKYSRQMIIIIERYAFTKKDIVYLQDTQFKPYDNNNLEVY
jgi:uncharacterized protein YxeA